MNARSDTLGQKMAKWKAEKGDKTRAEKSVRVARIGQGWIIGSLDTIGEASDRGVHEAISHCRLHHLPLSAIREVERTNPTLAMNLYKTLSFLSNKRHEATIQQLGQFVRILNTPPPRLRGGRSGLAKLQNA